MTSTDAPAQPRRVALVTGAARGLGEGIALEFARTGTTVVCVDLNGAEETARRAQELGGAGSVSERVDVTDSAAVDRLVESVVERFGRLDVIVNNAGVYTYGEIADTSDEDVRRILDINFFGTFNCCRAAARVMKQQGSGRIINMASQVGKVARPYEGVYAASKGAVVLLTQALALELGQYGITANSICPGTMLTAMTVQAITKQAEAIGSTFEAEKQRYIDAKIPAGRYGTPEDVGRLAVWLASDDASFITGSSQNLSGGEQVFY